MPWDDQREAEFRGYYAEGISHSEIAAKLGISRNASIGKAHRLGLQPRIVRKPKPKPWMKLGISERTWHRRHKGVRQGKCRGEKMTEDIAEIVTPVGNGPLGIVDLEPHHCRFPVEVPDQPMMYCGDPKALGSYCAKHYRMAHTRPERTRQAIYFSTGGRVV